MTAIIRASPARVHGRVAIDSIYDMRTLFSGIARPDERVDD